MAGFTLPKIKLPKLGGKKKFDFPLGLDIGSHSVKICHMAETGDGYSLTALGSALLPIGAVEEGTLQDPEAVAKVIAALIKNLNTKQKKVAITVSGYSVIVKKINLAVMEEDALEEYIQEEAGQYIPFDIEEVYLDFQDLKTNTEEYDRTDIMLVAAKKDVVDSYANMLRSAGLLAVVVDVDGFALENAYDFTTKSTDDVVLVDIGASKMSINVVSQGSSVLARDVVVGSRQLTEQIQSRFDLNFDDAEALKLGLVPAEEKQKELEEIVVSSCTQWALEIKKAIDLYYSNNPEGNLAKLVLSGGGSKVRGLKEFLFEETGIPTEIFNPFANVVADYEKIDPDYLKSIAPEMAISSGLSTRTSILL